MGCTHVDGSGLNKERPPDTNRPFDGNSSQRRSVLVVEERSTSVFRKVSRRGKVGRVITLTLPGQRLLALLGTLLPSSLGRLLASGIVGALLPSCGGRLIASSLAAPFFHPAAVAPAGFGAAAGSSGCSSRCSCRCSSRCSSGCSSGSIRAQALQSDGLIAFLDDELLALRVRVWVTFSSVSAILPSAPGFLVFLLVSMVYASPSCLRML